MINSVISEQITKGITFTRTILFGDHIDTYANKRIPLIKHIHDGTSILQTITLSEEFIVGYSNIIDKVFNTKTYF